MLGPLGAQIPNKEIPSPHPAAFAWDLSSRIEKFINLTGSDRCYSEGCVPTTARAIPTFYSMYGIIFILQSEWTTSPHHSASTVVVTFPTI